MTATTTRDANLPGGGPVSRWSPRRWAHHRYLWWAGALLVGALAAAVAIARDTSPEPGIHDTGALAVLATVGLLSPFLLVGLCMSLSSAVRRRVHDDVRTHGVGRPVRSEVPRREPGAPAWPPPREEVLLRVEVDRVPDAARVVERAVRSGRHRRIESSAGDLRLRSGRGWLTATARDGTVRHRAERRGLPEPYRARWELVLDGRRLHVDVRGLQDPPRRTLLEPDGTAWLLQMGIPSLVDQVRGRRAARLHPHGRLPEELAPDAAAFVLWFVCELEEHLARVRSYGQEVGAMRRDEVAEAWAGWPPPGRAAETVPDDERANA
ncbi:hypothetical protein [Actinomycetospora cinnamomea]|uniref:Uncharacterized protein n=1 Tax=Actinomycetospora cinnamomea TaxID=663609 RepID=A0A2U1FD00_9PSEU|nr:hypothetical protein [Actinomycetospora cinnamomea]PVZ10034.1 hypothetical protein C8D89_105110 [Actinomycetospora cinnamomea]